MSVLMQFYWMLDPEYLKFLDSLENPETPPTMTVNEVLEEVHAKAKERIAAHNSETPLLAFINKFKIEKKRTQEVRLGLELERVVSGNQFIRISVY